MLICARSCFRKEMINEVLNDWTNRYPLFWINLDRQERRRHRMEHAVRQGGWEAQRWRAVDAANKKNQFLTIPKPWRPGCSLPGLQRAQEADASRITTKAELACLSSWQTLIEALDGQKSPSGWFLLMEDDVGSSLACPEDWPFSLDELVESLDSNALVVQLSPISSKVRLDLYQQWLQSKGKTMAVPKARVRSHGNGAVLIHKNAIIKLSRRIGKLIHRYNSSFHLLTHPCGIRPVADKWLYACLPSASSWVCTYPIFNLDASGSDLHTDHIEAFHKPSSDITLKIWEEDKKHNLIKHFNHWLSIQ